ncbi:MAG: 6-phosphofructokinase [Clostridiales bacterium]|nr:MAG: 6-phosphofructokinase [Clostridiales bacterium]
MRKIGVFTSGGDAPGMNPAIRAIVRYGKHMGLEITGIKRGYSGLIEGDMSDMDLSAVGDIIHRGGTVIKTARSEEFKTEAGFKKALEIIKIFDLDALVAIGGDVTYKGLQKLSEKGVPVIGIPGTIDNDFGYTDVTIGFDTAVNTVVDAISNLRDTSVSHGRINIVEVMGRHCGDIALHAGLAGGAENVVIPEIYYDTDDICRKIIEGRNRGKIHSLIIVAEGVGKPYDLAEEIKEKTGYDTRVSILGYLQRGGSPSAFDRILAARLGARAIDLLVAGNHGRAVGIKNSQVIDVPIENVFDYKKATNEDYYRLIGILSR